MSHIKLAKGNKFSQSTSSFSSGPGVGDSSWTIKSMVTNVATGALFGLIGLFSLFGLLVLPILFGSSSVFATASSITITPSSVSTYVNIPPTAEGKFAATGTVTYGITTTHASGYTASVSATDLSFVDTAGINGTVDATYTIAPLATGTAITAAQFAASEGTAYTNKWGYLPSTYYNPSTSATVTNNDKYFPAPIGTTQKLDETNIANPSTPNNYDITVGARVDHTLEQGAYTTTITVSAVGNPTPYTVHYYANVGNDTIADMPGTPTTDPSTGEVMSTITKEAIGATDTIDTASPHRTTSNNTAYLFSGWCTARTAIDGGCGGTQYTIAGEYTVDQTASTNELTLYAMWRTDPCYNKTLLHDLVTCQVKTTGSGATNTLTEQTQTLAQMQAVIGEPVSDSPYADTSNSGVYKYDVATYGTASDAANTSDIYYFRGILDGDYVSKDTLAGASEQQGVPSTGDSAYYQNYARLGNTCWRIVRTTGSGGTKMIYNGPYSTGTVANSCANNATAASISVNNSRSFYYNRGTPSASDDHYGTSGFTTYVGYNYNSDYAYNNTGFTSAIDNLKLFNNKNNLDDNGNPTANSQITKSNLRTVIENWYNNNSNLSSYEYNSSTMSSTNNTLETSAGWCDDRTTSTGNTTIPYALNSRIDFGAEIRNGTANTKASLTCPNTTGQDLLTIDNNYLGVPLAPLTEDEVVLAGHGHSAGSYPYDPTEITTYSSNWAYRSFLRSGQGFWLLSPAIRHGTYSYIDVYAVYSDGYSGSLYVDYSTGARPAVSLTSGTTVASGIGTSTDPWVINVPSGS